MVLDCRARGPADRWNSSWNAKGRGAMSSGPTRRLSLTWPAILLSICIVGSIAASSKADEAKRSDSESPAASLDQKGVLRLMGGDFVAGQFGRSDQSDVIPWLYPRFSGTLLVESDRVTHISFAAPKQNIRAVGLHCFDLRNGDRLFGRVVSADDSEVVIATTDWGNVSIARSKIWRVTPWDDGERLLFAGPKGDAAWQHPATSQGRWAGIGGIMRTDKVNSIAALPVEIPQQCLVDLEVSWEGKPNFSLAIGDVVPQEKKEDENENKVPNRRNNNRNAITRPGGKDGPSLRLEIWENNLVVVWESEDFADLAPIAPMSEFGHRLRVLLEIDRYQEEARVLSPSGELLAKVRTNGEDGEKSSRPGIRLRNITGTLQLDALQIIARHSSNAADQQDQSSADPKQQKNNSEATDTAADKSTNEENSNQVDGEEVEEKDEPGKKTAIIAEASDDRAQDLIETVDGRRLTGRWSVEDNGQWSIESSDGPISLSPDEIAFARLGRPETERDQAVAGGSEKDDEGASSRAKDKKDKNENQVQLLTHSGIRLTGGQWLFRKDEMQLKAASFEEMVTIPANRIARVRPRWQVYSQEDWQAMAKKFPVMEAESLRLHGKLLDSSADTEPSPLRFLPTGMTAVTLSERINAVMRFVPKEDKKATQSAQQNRRPGNPVEQFLTMANRFLDAFPKDHSQQPSRIYLDTGEIVSASLGQMDEDKIAYQSNWTKNTRLMRAMIRAIELAPLDEDFKLDEEERDRLLMVPRVHQKSPPTDLIVATNGDLMRGRLLGLNNRTVWVESRLYRLEIDRNLVSHLVAFPSDPDKDSEASSALPDDPMTADSLPVYAIAKNGDRLWLKPQEVDNRVLVGQNRWLDQCRLPLSQLELLHIGRNLYDHSNTKMEAEERYAGFPEPFINWKLKDAPKPPIPGGGPGESESVGPPGTESNLVGKEAPELKLPLLEGGEFDLAKQRGKIIVLDFWASWCGPCMQAMPVVDEVIEGFDQSRVELVTVNLQEDKSTIRETMKRLGLDVRCAMDQEGLAAKRYQASAIPQTVIIDQKGVICRLFVGGGNQLGKQLDEALREVLNQVDL